MALYTDQNTDVILSRMLARVDARYDKRTGSIIFNSTAPAANELSLLYEALDYILDQALPDTAVREFLIRHCAARGITPFPATAARVIGRFAPASITIPEATRYNCGEFYYVLSEKIDNPAEVVPDADTTAYSYYYLDCESAGVGPNSTTGRLIPVTAISGLATAEIIEVSIPGSDEEETEHLRERYYSAFGAEAFGGNIADYRQKILAQPGVGAVKVHPAWNGGGTVLVVIAAADSGRIIVPTATLVETVQNATDPESMNNGSEWGNGYGFAPIGHHVTVMGVTGEPINISAILTFAEGYGYDDVKDEIAATLSAYYDDLNKVWMSLGNITVRASEIISRILSNPAIIDVSGVLINGSASPTATLDTDSIAISGTFTNA